MYYCMQKKPVNLSFNTNGWCKNKQTIKRSLKYVKIYSCIFILAEPLLRLFSKIIEKLKDFIKDKNSFICILILLLRTHNELKEIKRKNIISKLFEFTMT